MIRSAIYATLAVKPAFARGLRRFKQKNESRRSTGTIRQGGCCAKAPRQVRHGLQKNVGNRLHVVVERRRHLGLYEPDGPVGSIENVVGPSYADAIGGNTIRTTRSRVAAATIPSGAEDILYGGNVQIPGGGRDDHIYADAGNDRLWGDSFYFTTG